MSQDAQDQEVAFSGSSIGFDYGIALKCGINAAVILNHIWYWLKTNRDNPNAIKENRVWMYESQERMSEYLDVLTPKEIRNGIKSLLDNGIIEKGNFNKNPFDQTNWYTLAEPYFKKMFPIRPQGQMHETPGANPIRPYGQMYKEGKKKENKYKDYKQQAADACAHEAESNNNLQSAAAACEKISETISLRNYKGQEVSILVSDIYRHFLKFPYSAALLEKMLAILRAETKPVSNILKLAEKICERLYSEEPKIIEENKSYADKIKSTVDISKAPSGKINILEELKKHERESQKSSKSHR